jgi:hypothetical protein
MGRHIWGKTVRALVLAVTVTAVSGCGSSSDEDTAAKPAAKAKFDTDGGCPGKEPGTCWEQMQALMKPARDLRKAMNTEKSVGADFWTEAYVLIDAMEKGIAVGDDQGVPVADEEMAALMSNRDDVFGSAHDLSDWLDENPVA